MTHPPVYLAPPCQACLGPHRLAACATFAAADLLDRCGLPGNASIVRRRAEDALASTLDRAHRASEMGSA